MKKCYSISPYSLKNVFKSNLDNLKSERVNFKKCFLNVTSYCLKPTKF